MNVVVCFRAPPPGPEVDALASSDALALAQALALGADDHQTTALLGGTSMEAGSLRLALAAGLDRALRVAADDMAGSDFHTIGQLLAIALRRIGADLVLTGVRSDDEGLGAAPAAIARHLGANYVVGVEEIVVASAGTVDVVVRGGGRKRRLRVKLPAVLTIARGPATPAQRPPRTGAAPAIEVIPLSDPEATVVRRRTELPGRLEPASRGVETVTSAAALVAARDRR